MGSPYNIGQSAAGFGNTLAERYKQWQDSIRQGAAQAGRFVGDVGETVGDAYSQGGLFGLPAKPIIGAMESFGAGMRGEAMPGQDIELKQESLLPPAPRWAIEDGLKLGGVDAVGEDGVPENLRAPEGVEAPAPAPAGRVQATINGKTYDYSGGKSGGAPQVSTGSAFGQDYTPASGGTFSQMNPIDQSMKSLAQLYDEQALAEAQPVPNAPFPGATVGSMRKIEEEIARKAAEQRAKVGGELAVEEGKSRIRQNEQASVLNSLNSLDAEAAGKLAELRQSARYLAATPEQRQAAEALLLEQVNPARRRENLVIASNRGNVQVRQDGY